MLHPNFKRDNTDYRITAEQCPVYLCKCERALKLQVLMIQTAHCSPGKRWSVKNLGLHLLQARNLAPAIIFIDEVDAVGRRRGGSKGNDERDQTLNQLLIEMDGFGEGATVIVMAATNRLDILDPALIRPGRFDRVITIGEPDFEGRIQILQVASHYIKLWNIGSSLPHPMQNCNASYGNSKVLSKGQQCLRNCDVSETPTPRVPFVCAIAAAVPNLP